MGFEKRVLLEVADVLKRDKSASFTLGTLFVECDKNEADIILHRLSQEFGSGTVQISGPIQGEYAFDFVAKTEDRGYYVGLDR
jgi:hypothetical protein